MNFDMQELQASMARSSFKGNQRRRFRVYRKLQGMLSANESLGRALERLWYNASEIGKYPNRPEALAIRAWMHNDRLGRTLTEGMEGWVPSGELYIIRAGEESGTLSQAFLTIQVMGERSAQMRSAVYSAVGYPLFMVVLVSGVLWMFGVNLIANIRQYAPKKVLESIATLASFSDFVMNYGLAVLLGGGMICIMIASTLPFWRGPWRAKFDMYAPWAWYRVLQGAGFLLGMSALLGAQVPLRRALEIMEEQGNPWMRERVGACREEVLRGYNLGEALRKIEMNFPDPKVAVDLEILSERGDVSQVVEQVTHEWIDEQIVDLKTQALVARNAGMIAVASVIAMAMLSIMNITTVITDMSSKPGGGF